MKRNETRNRMAAMLVAAVFAVVFGTVSVAAAGPVYQQVQPLLSGADLAALIDAMPVVDNPGLPAVEEPVIGDGGFDEPCYPVEPPEDVIDDGDEDGITNDDAEPTVPDGGADQGPVPSNEETPTVPDDGADEGTDKPQDRDHLPFTGGNDLGWTVAALGIVLLGFAVGAASIPNYNKDRNYRY